MKKTLTRSIIFLSLCSPVVLCVLLAIYIGAGLDLTDDSYYILLAQQPENFSGSISQFAYYTKWLYLAAGQDIKWFRILGVLILFSASALFSLYFLTYAREHTRCNTNFFACFCLLLSTGISFYFWRWYPSPSYNWLNFIGCMLVGAGLFGFAQSSIQTRTYAIFAGTILGIGLGLAALAKPTTAILLLFVLLWWLQSNWQRKTGVLFIAVAVLSSAGLCAWHLWGEIGGLPTFQQNLSLGLDFSRVQSRHGFPRLILRAMKDLSIAVASGLLLTFIFSTLYKAKCFQLKAHNILQASRHRIFLSMLSISVFALALVAIDPGGLLAGGWLGLISAYACFYRSEFAQTPVASDADSNTSAFATLAPLLLLLTLIFSYGFGSSLSFSNILTGAQIFLASACMYFAWLFDRRYSSTRYSTLACLFVICSLVLLVNSEFRQPYRLISSLGGQSVTASFHKSYTAIDVDPVTAKYVNTLTELAAAGGWKARTPLIDMSGDTPGALLILNAKVLGRPWFMGDGSAANRFAELALSGVDKQELKDAWLLTAADSPLKIDEKILEQFGLQFPQDYIYLGGLRTGFRPQNQSLWKPASD